MKLKSNVIRTTFYISRSNDTRNFCVRGYIPLIQKVSVTHMLGLVVNMREGLSFAWDSESCLENFFIYFLDCFYFIQSVS